MATKYPNQKYRGKTNDEWLAYEAHVNKVAADRLARAFCLNHRFEAKHLPTGDTWVVQAPSPAAARKCIEDCKRMAGGKDWKFGKVSGEARQPEIDCVDLMNKILLLDMVARGQKLPGAKSSPG